MYLYDGKCHLCKRKKSDTIDHIVPVAWGGSDHPANLKPAHRSCNSSKGSQRPGRWAWRIPVMWEEGYGANVEGRIKVPHWNYAGLRTFLGFLLLGYGLWWVGEKLGLELPILVGASIFIFPIIYNLTLFFVWRYQCIQATLAALQDDTIIDPQEWLDYETEQKNKK
jgi:hypothetical protein